MFRYSVKKVTLANGPRWKTSTVEIQAKDWAEAVHVATGAVGPNSRLTRIALVGLVDDGLTYTLEDMTGTTLTASSLIY